MKTTEENNKLIAEFMGLEIITDGISLFDTNYNALKQYNKDWNFLMQVVEKIESINNSDFIIEHTSVMMPNVFGTKQFVAKTKIESVYNACIAFIEWYNENAGKELKTV